jgi:hypothetical protein
MSCRKSGGEKRRGCHGVAENIEGVERGSVITAERSDSRDRNRAEYAEEEEGETETGNKDGEDGKDRSQRGKKIIEKTGIEIDTSCRLCRVIGEKN